MLQGEACLAPTTDRAFRVGAQHAAPTYWLAILVRTGGVDVRIIL